MKHRTKLEWFCLIAALLFVAILVASQFLPDLEDVIR